ncbi:prephenate dehydratase [Candidatus Kryptobacter tengchongensis]|nr:prephenate dehydratase [Candidatus Kryptobacter tengchongensis]
MDLKLKVKVGFQGERGAFSEQAGYAFFGSKMIPVALHSFEDVFKSVKKGEVDYGVIPIENSLYGSIHQNYDLLQKYNVYIVGEVKLRIKHYLLANYGVKLSDVKKIYSHPQAISQCEGFLKKLRDVEIIPTYDTAGSAKMIKENKILDGAAIAGKQAGIYYGLKILKSGIENHRKNFTRFLVLSKEKIIARRNPKTSIIFTTKNIPGALFSALSVFAYRYINLLKIESRPIIGQPWRYMFYLDFEGSIEDKLCADAIKELKKMTQYYKFLGTYEKGREIE